MSGLQPEKLELEKIADATPPLYIELPEMGLLRVLGPDAERFLQGQMTCDLNQLHTDNWLLGAHCNAQGKVWSIFRAIRIEQGTLLIQNKSTIPQSLAQLKKFSVFNQVEASDESNNYRCFIIAGKNADTEVSTLLGVDATAQYSSSGDVHALQLMPWAYLCIVPASFALEHELVAAKYWDAMQIEQGWPNFASVHQETFIPQMLNLDKLGGINFKKGCYIGQETIARTHYRGQNKRRLIRLIGEAESTPGPDDQMEIQLGENWRRAGAVISAVRYDNGVIAIQAVLPSDLEAQAKLRIKGQDDSKFTPCLESDETESINE